MDMRELKGLDLAARCRIKYEDGVWLVPSQSGNGTYRVLLAAPGDACLCDDFPPHRKPCKHIHAARIVREQDHGGKSPVLNMDVVPPLIRLTSVTTIWNWSIAWAGRRSYRSRATAAKENRTPSGEKCGSTTPCGVRSS